MRKFLRGALMALKWIGLAIVGLLAAIALWARVSHRGDTKISAPGRLVEVEAGRRMHLLCQGEGQPAVLLEAGLGDYGWSSWYSVQPQIATKTRTCSYDRAGTGWSDPPRVDPMPSAMVDDLRALLAAAGEKGPFVLVGHSLGGPIVRHYARRFPAEVSGLILVDGSHEDQMKRLPPLPAVAEATMKLFPAVHALGLDRLAGAFAPDSASRTRAVMVSTDQAARNTAWVFNHLEPFLAQARDSGTALGDIPLVALTASTMAGPGMPPETAAAFHATWVTLHQEIAAYSTRGRQAIVPGSTHYIQRDQPQAVVDAVTRMVDELRAAVAAAPATSPLR